MQSMCRLYISIMLLGFLFASTAVCSAADITLEVWNSDLSVEGLAYLNNTLIPRFVAAHPGVKVNLTKTPWGTALTEKTVTSYAAGVGPDIIVGGAEFVDGYVENGFVIPLDKQIQQWGQLKDYIPSSLGAVTYKGHLYGLPMGMDFRTTAFNSQLMLIAGIDTRNPPRTWDDFAKVAKRLTRHNGTTIEVAGMSTKAAKTNPYQIFNTFVWQNGGEILNPDKTAPAFFEPKAISALEYWVNLIREISGTYDREVRTEANFVNGKIASFYQINSVSLSRIAKNAGHDPNEFITYGPGPKQTVEANIVNTNWLAVGSQSKHPDLAWEFLTFISEINNYVAYTAENGTNLPVRLSALRSEWVRSQPWMIKALTIASESGKATWTARYFADLRDSLNPELLSALNGQVASRVALENAAKAWQNILSR